MSDGFILGSEALFTAILHSVWQGCVLAAIYAVSSRRLQASQSRYLLAISLFLVAPVAFVVTAVLAFNTEPAQGTLVQQSAALPLATYFALAWCVGSAFVGGRFLCGCIWLRLVIVRNSFAVPAPIERLFHEARTAVAASRRICIRASDSIRSPMVTGVIRPIVLLPASMLSGVPSNVLHAVFIHELLHVRRLDHIAVFLQAIGESILFYHPAVRWLSAEARRNREYRCDDESVRHLGNRFEYARALVAVEETPGYPSVPALLMNGGELMKRVERLMSDDATTGSARMHYTGLFAFLMTALLFYSLSYSSDEPDVAEAGHELSISWLPPAVTRYSDLIEQAARRHNVSPDVLALMLLVESHGEPEAESSAGARGLMQVMPKTGEAIAAERGLEGFGPDQLFDPATNIDFGAWYLANMMERFAEDPSRQQELAIAAYNAGPRRAEAYANGDEALSVESARYRDLLLSMLSEADDDRSLVLEGRKATLRDRLPAFKRPVEGRITSQFGADGGARGMHSGVDIAAPEGAPVRAPVRGQVSAVGEDATRGKYVAVRHANGVESRYYHLSDVDVEVGRSVEAGETLGAVGSTGASTKAHLHFEIRELGEAVSPSLYGVVLD